MSDRKIWFGNRQFAQWIPCPSVGADYGRQGAQQGASFLQGGAWRRNTLTSAKTYDLSWSLTSRDNIRAITDFADGVYGPGPFYWIDPFAGDKNVLPQSWATPWLASVDAPSLALNALTGIDVIPELIPNPDQSKGYPAQMARYTPTTNHNLRKAYVPIPPGHTAWVGAHGDPNSASGVKVQPTLRGDSAGAATIVPVTGVGTAQRFTNSFPANGEQSGIELSLQNDLPPVTNLFTNPSFEAGSGTVAVRTNHSKYPGDAPSGTGGWGTARMNLSNPGGYLRGVANDVANTGGVGIIGSTSPSAMTPAAPGDVWRIAAEIRTNGSLMQAALGLQYYDSSGAYITGSQSLGPTVDGNATVWREAEVVSPPAPAGTAYFRIVAYLVGMSTVGDILDLRTVTAEKTAVRLGGVFSGNRQPVVRENLIPGLPEAINATRTLDVMFDGDSWTQFTGTATRGGSRTNVDLANLVDGATYTAAVEVANPGSGPLEVRVDWCNVLETADVYTLAPGERRIFRTTAARDPYTSSYRFVDVRPTTASNATTLVRVLTLEAGTSTEPPFDGSNGAPRGFETAWAGSPGVSTSFMYDADFTVGWAGTPNASVSELRGVGIPWVVPFNAFVVRSGHWSKSGTYSARVIPSNESTNSGFTVGSGTYPKQATHIATTYLKEPVVNPSGNVRTLSRYSPASRSQGPNVAGEFEHRFVSPPETSAGTLDIRIGCAQGDGEMWIDCLLVTEGVYDGPWFDGNAAGARWIATPNASASIMENFPITLAGVMVQVLPNGRTPEPGGFISGQGHSGCDWDQLPVQNAYSAGLDLVGLNARMIETGQWL